MVMAIAARWRRGTSRLGLAAALGVAWPLTLLAQDDAPKPAPRPAAVKPAKPHEVDKDENPAPAPVSGVNPGGDIFRDPRAEDLIKNLADFKPIKNATLRDRDAEQVMAWAAGNGIVDKNVLGAYVRKQAADMTSPKVLAGLGSQVPKENEDAIQVVESAFEKLISPITRATKAVPPRREFVGIYTEQLLKVMPELLTNHMYARLEGMIALSRTGDVQAIDTFIAQLADRDQIALVKQLAALGLSIAVKSSRQALPADMSTRAAMALVNFLNEEPDVVWTARYRALEALGWLRQAARNPLGGKFEMVEVAANILADPKERLEVRAWAAWALGMMRVDNGNASVNYPKITADLARLAVELGEKILAVKSDQQDDQAHELITLLAWPLYNALKGEPDQPRSGLLNNSAVLNSSGAFMKGLEPLVQAEARDAVELGRAAGAQLHTQRTKELTQSTKALKDYLSQNPQAPLVKPAGIPAARAAAAAPQVAADSRVESFRVR